MSPGSLKLGFPSVQWNVRSGSGPLLSGSWRVRADLQAHFVTFSGPINREMRHLISSLQNHNHQLKGDAQRYKRKLREVQAEIGKVRRGSCLGKAFVRP